MPIFLDTRGRSNLGIAVCARCGIKHSRDELSPDPNYPGLMCCSSDLDLIDPYRLPARETEDITMEWCRPDANVADTGPLPNFAPTPVTNVFLQDEFGNYLQDEFGNPFLLGSSSSPNGVPYPIPTSISPAFPWQPNTFYPRGASVTPLNQNDPNVTTPQLLFVCLFPGRSAAAAIPTVYMTDGFGNIMQDGFGQGMIAVPGVPATGLVPPPWPTKPGVVFKDGTVTWLCLGTYLDEGTGSAYAAPRPSVV